ncbi:MAG TPA: aldo/keto reductase [Candidatus Eisenbacteria bacterium]|jgi:aryl-alcohol dehydrogenase-like predicted oxidoreductase|nr:aldo/keto reductase [Candidatus Eisenbacteria bacterium]
MLRRDFLHCSSRAAAGAWFASRSLAHRLAVVPPPAQKFAATDTVTLGSTGIKTSRLAMGTGTVGAGKHSHQTALGMDGLPRLLLNGYDNGLRFFDAADSYGSHPHVAEALKHVDRSKVTVLTKSWARDAKEMAADVERFRRELGIEQIDMVLMHCLTEADWTTRYRPVMDVLEEAKQRRIIRAHGCSCHSIEALRAAAQSPWVDVDLARVNPVGAHMDADPDTVVSVLREMKAAGKAVIGMKILGQGALRDRQDDALRFALGLNLLDAFTIGAESIAEQNDLVRRIAAAA